MNPEYLREKCFEFVEKSAPADAAHDISHIKRVVKTTLYLTDIEEAKVEITLPAACLHDCVAVPKDSPLRSQGSRLSLIHISEPTRPTATSRMPSSA